MKDLMMTESIMTYSTAKGFGNSAYAMLSNPARLNLPEDSSLFLGFHLLLGFSVELYLKSVLQFSGWSEKALRSSDIRHDLKNLLHSVSKHNFDCGGAVQLVDVLHDNHKTYEFRYSKDGSTYRVVPPSHLFAALSVLDQNVDVLVGASVSEGVIPSGGWVLPFELSTWRLNGIRNV